MRIALPLAILGLASTAVGQMPLPPAGNFFTASLTRGFYFQCPANVPNAVVTALSVPDITDPFQVVEFIEIGANPPPAFPGTITGTTLFYDNATAGQSLISLPNPIVLTPGIFYGVLGAGTASVGGGTSQNPYSTQTGTFTSDILGVPVDIARFGTQSGIGANGGMQPCWSEAAGTISRVEVYITAAGGSFALNETLGVGGGASPAGDGSAYEVFTGNYDLANSSHTYTWLGDGYIILDGDSTGLVAPTGAGALTLTDDDIEAITLPFALPCPRGILDTVYLCSNGFLSFEAGATADFSESLAEFLGNQSRLCFLWDDFNPAAGGTVDAEVDPNNPSIFHITFTDVPQFATADMNNVQISLFDNGNIEVKYGAVNSLDSIVGITTGNGATDPGASDYSDMQAMPVGTGTPIGPFTTGQFLAPVDLVGATRPITGTSWDLTCGNNQPGTVFGLNIFGESDPMINDLSAVGIPMPGNPLRASLELIEGPIFLAPGANSFSYSLPIPNDPMLIGIELFTQGVAFGGMPNPFDAQTSNGIKGTIGDQ